MNLGTQLLAATGLIVLMALVHGIGILGITRLLNLEAEALRSRQLGIGSFGLLVSMTICLFGLHIFEIAIFALFYLAVGALQGIEEALFYSASSYSTLGQTVEGFAPRWRLVGAIEGVVGFLLLGWSTAVFVADMNKLLRKS